jgi:hypothetical protein
MNQINKEMLRCLLDLTAGRHNFKTPLKENNFCEICGEHICNNVHFKIGESHETDIQKAKEVVDKVSKEITENGANLV